MPPARDVTTSRREMLREAAEAIEQGELTTASGLLQKLESGTSPNPDVQQLRIKLQGRRLELRLLEAVARADEATHGGSLEEAEAAINALADISPRHPELERLRRAHQERIDDRQVAALTSRARQALQQDRLDEAEALVAEALSLAPDAADALSVQQKLSDRTKAQRIARLVAQASRALDQDDETGARRAIDALVRIDPVHRDVARLQARLLALTVEVEEAQAHAARSGPVPIVAPPPAAAPVAPPPPAPAPPAVPAQAPVPAPAQAPVRVPAPVAAPVPKAAPPSVATKSSAPPSAGAPPPAPGDRRASSGTSPADRELLRSLPPVNSEAETRPITTGPSSDPPTSNRSPLVIAAVLALVAAVGMGAYYRFALAPESARTSGTDTTEAPEAATPANGSSPAGTPQVTNTTATPEPAPSSPVPPTEAPKSPVEPANTPVTPRADPWAGVRQHAAAGRFDRAMAAIDQVQGVPRELMQEERRRITENARRNALAARRGAEDLLLTKSAPYQRGMARQEQADRDRTAQRFKAAVSGYIAAQGLFHQALGESGRPVPPDVVEPPDTGTTPANPPAPTGPAPAPAPSEPSVDLSTWSTEEARAVLDQFKGAYLGRDAGGLRRLWPTMDPSWVSEFRDAFATTGSLVCVFENVSIVRATDQFMMTGRLLTQLPGEEPRRRNLVITLVPARDRLVIGNVRVR